MKELNVFQHNHVDVVDSRAVAQMIGKQHKNLLRDISSYEETLRNSTGLKIAPSDFFVESTYKDSTGRTLPCYLLTKKGCDMVANKMTGEKGVLFTAAYVTAFENMRKHIEKEKPVSNDPKPMTEYQRERISLEKAKMYAKLAQDYEGPYKQVLQAHATKEMSGTFVLPLPASESPTYSAAEVGDILGISAHKVGQIANQRNLKTAENGRWFVDKSKYSQKEVSTFRYYQEGVDAIREAYQKGGAS